jgi:hypothetical protein
MPKKIVRMKLKVDERMKLKMRIAKGCQALEVEALRAVASLIDSFHEMGHVIADFSRPDGTKVRVKLRTKKGRKVREIAPEGSYEKIAQALRNRGRHHYE